ncbi:GyrI-like domain-containing protein [Cyclobacterium amurskyense]|nr:GyrI-like domain-containing protein [Cyclobacterium amurskyense]
MQPKIVNIKDKHLLGISCRMSVNNNKTPELWKKFMSILHTISSNKPQEFIALQVYEASYFSSAFDPSKEFDQWACMEVENGKEIHQELTPFLLKGGLFAVFNYKGPSTDHSVFEYIYGTWIPESQFQLDDRPHFQVMGEKYSNNSPSSEEEIWIPLRRK